MRKRALRGTLEELAVDIAIGAVLLMAFGVAIRFAIVHLDLITLAAR